MLTAAVGRSVRQPGSRAAARCRRHEDDRTLRLCDGTPLSPCDGPFTGSACDLPCTPGASSLACSLERTCHSDGRTYGLSARNTLLYPASPEDTDAAIATDFETWLVEHPEDVGLAAGSSTDHIELHPLGTRSTAGPLTIFRFAQTYHGLPVLAPDGIVTLIHGPHGAVAFTGAIVDGRTHYAHDDTRASSDAAVRAMLVHDSARSGVPVGELDVEHATPVAVPMRQAIGWAGFVRKKGGATVARVVVDADPVIDEPPLPLWSYDELVAADLGDTQPIEVQGLDVSGDLVAPGYQPHTSLTTGTPLLGSVDDVSLEIQLATERVVLLDLHGELEVDLDVHATRVLDPFGEFLANAGSELGAQTSYHLFQSWYDLIDGHLTDPVTGTKRWDSANLLYTNGASPGDVPPGTYSPRVLTFTNANAADCPAGATACVHRSGYVPGYEEAIPFPELAHVPLGASGPETTATVLLLGEDTGPVTLAHELGHAVDRSISSS